MRLRPVLADRLAFPLLYTQQIDDRRAKHHNEQESGEDRAARAKRCVAKHVERVDLVAEVDEFVQHPASIPPGGLILY